MDMRYSYLILALAGASACSSGGGGSPASGTGSTTETTGVAHGAGGANSTGTGGGLIAGGTGGESGPESGGAMGTGAQAGTGGIVGVATGGAPASSGGAGGGGGIEPNLSGSVCATLGAVALPDAFATGYSEWKASQVDTSCASGARVMGCPAGDDKGTCSEAQAYGMLLAVVAEDKSTFDALNAYRLQMLKQSSTADQSLMPWAIWNAKACPPVAESGDKNSATDADIDAAMALLEAHALWGSSEYKSQALTILASVVALEVSGTGSAIRLLPGNQNGDLRDYVAYYTPAYFSVFAQLTGETRWTELKDAYYTRLLAQQCPGNGQIYDDFQNPGECKFWWDSCRVPWRVALDFAWHGEARAKQFLDTLSGFVGVDPAGISEQKNSAFAGAGVLSGISSDDETRMQTLCNAWAGSSGLDDGPYFQKTLRLLYISVAGGMMFRPSVN